MGEVFRARDTRLQREVALKVLPASFASDADRRTRFEREAQAIASLSHPNILAIHDFGATADAPPISYIVTELLHGSTLRDRISEGPLPVRKAIDVTIQIARGLAAAHSRGIVHRDLKPENVFLLDDGQVKILDFGLARPGAAAGGTAETVAAVTDPGTVMGTVGYMAPEQVRGQVVDARADLFSLGAVFYEMLAGKPAFKRDTAADTMSAILNQDPPDLGATRTDFTPALDRILRHSLEKNVNERFQTARDVAFALEALSGSNTVSGAAPIVTAPAARPRFVPIAGALVLAAAAAVGGYAIGHRSAAPGPSIFERKTFDPQFIANARFMPDGAIVYSASRTGQRPELFMLRPDTVVPQPLGLHNVHLLSASKTGELAVLTDVTHANHRIYHGTLARVVVGSAPRPWLEHVTDADWSPDGSTLAIARDLENGRYRLEYPIGTTLYEAVGYLSEVRVSPDGTRVAFFEHRHTGDDRGWVKVIDQNKKVATLSDEYWGMEGLAWMDDGATLLYAAASGRTTTEMEPYLVDAAGRSAPRVALHTMNTTTVFDVRGGRWLIDGGDVRAGIYVREPGDSADRDLSWLDESAGSSLSADGKTLVFTDGNWSAGPDYAVALRTTDGAPAVRLGPGAAGLLSPDGKWVVAALFSSDRIVLYPTGPGEPRPLNLKSSQFSVTGWFPDSASILLCGGEPGAKSRCYREPIAGGPMTPVTPEGSTGAMVAPNGRVLSASGPDDVSIYDPSGASPPVAVKVLKSTDSVLAVTSDSRSVIVATGRQLPIRLERVDLTTGARSLITEIRPPDTAGLTNLQVDGVIADGKGYLYSTVTTRSTLFVVR